MEGIDDLDPSTSGSGKRLNEDEDNLEGKAITRKRAKTVPDVSPETAHPKPTESSEFYYADGNIIDIVEDVEFCLHLSRRMKHCTLFSHLWELATDGPSTGEARHTLEGISAADFTEFLRVFENPLYVRNFMLRMADKIGCKTVLDVAKRRLCEHWPLTVPQRTNFMKKGLSNSIAIIELARQFNIPEILKRAHYEILRSYSFWANIVANRDSVKLADTDLLTLYHARHVLQQEWRTLLLTPPVPKDLCLSSKGCVYTESATRSEKWRSQVIDHLEDKAVDPIRYI
ncbi:hypothetical protein TRAPUB_5470 [Trametes pubescens]|uniref:BTB domain-containing protein n=1 Tax=Trametes pubescens TaxID=154538 RepID=A0A1M2V8H8_TRAPU|nr:hypothetical protein TRAPUB_5470 [Trametes pubescens]